MTRWWARRRGLPREIRRAAELGRGERMLATAREMREGDHLLATSWRVVVVDPDGRPSMSRPWLDVDAGAWDPRTTMLTITWADGGRLTQWDLGDGQERFAAVFQERVDASVVIGAPLQAADGNRSRALGKAAVRRDFATGRLVKQIVWGRGARRDDPSLLAHADAVLDDLGEQAGMS